MRCADLVLSLSVRLVRAVPHSYFSLCIINDIHDYGSFARPT